MERIVIKEVSKKFKIGSKNKTILSKINSSFSGRESKETIHVLKEISLKVNEGENLGIIGKNGSGKTTLLRIIGEIYKPDKGEVYTKGKIISSIGLGEGLKLRLTMRDNIYLICSIFGLNQKEIKEKFDSIVDFAELNNFVDTKLYQFSSGMIQRLVFSIIIHCNGEIFLFDEVSERGDNEFNKKCGKKLRELIKQGLSVVSVSHKREVIENYCDRVIWIDNGKIIKEGNPKEVSKAYFNNSTSKNKRK